MGSFSVSCALTNLTLNNRDAVLIPLAPARFVDGVRNHPSLVGGANFVSNEGAVGLFGPLTLPLIGRVGDYGEMESVEEDANTEFLRSKIKDFDGFLEAAVRGGHVPEIDKIARKSRQTRFPKSTQWNGNLSGCWIAREAWDLFSTQSWDESGAPDHTVWYDAWIEPQVLKGLGFVKGKKDEATAKGLFGEGPHQGDRYNTPYTHPALPDLIVWCDEHMSSQASYKGKPLTIQYRFPDFVKGLKSVGLALPEDRVDWAMTTSVYRGHLLKARSMARMDARLNRDRAQHLQEYPQFNWHMVDHEETPTGERQVFCDRSIFSRNKDAMHVTLLKNPQGGEPDWDIWSCPLGKDGEGHDFKHYHHPQMDFPAGLWEALKVRGWKPRKARRHALLYSDPYLRGFPEETLHLYGRKFLSDPFLPMVEAVLTLERNMYAANRMMAPTPTGYQCGHYPAQMKVAELTLKLAKAKIAERKRYR